MFRIIRSTDGQHVGEVLDSTDEGNIITFLDGDVVSVDKVFSSSDKLSVIITNANYVLTLEEI